MYKLIILFLVFIFACTKAEHQPSLPEGSPLNEESQSSWFLKNHANKIAQYDIDRNRYQIKVLNQIGAGARQCGYHAVRNLFYLGALSLAIKNRDSDLINKLYHELHDAEKFKSFVNALAEMKGCPIEYYHEL